MTVLCEPMLLKAAGKHSLWGGDKLIREYGKDYLEAPLAETWECSTHDNGLSIVDSGIWKGRTLKSVLKEHPEFLGSKYEKIGEIPVIVKFIDADKDLSIQVHPDDEFAAHYENGALGKAEMWYVAEALPGSKLIYGFYDNVSKKVVNEKLASGNIVELLQKIPVNSGDCFYIKPGVVHAIGKGILLVEVQEKSDLTYRLYDYGRKDKNGNQRMLHIEKALNVCCFKKSDVHDRKMRCFRYTKDVLLATICQCKYFNVKRYSANLDVKDKSPLGRESLNSFLIFVCLKGNGSIFSNNSIVKIEKGRTVFIPAGLKLKVSGCFDGLLIEC